MATITKELWARIPKEMKGRIDHEWSHDGSVRFLGLRVLYIDGRPIFEGIHFRIDGDDPFSLI